MIRQLSRSIREYKMYAILAPLMMVGGGGHGSPDPPPLMAGFMDSGVKTSDMSFVLRQGGGLLLCAMASLCWHTVGHLCLPGSGRLRQKPAAGYILQSADLFLCQH